MQTVKEGDRCQCGEEKTKGSTARSVAAEATGVVEAKK